MIIILPVPPAPAWPYPAVPAEERNTPRKRLEGVKKNRVILLLAMGVP